MMTENPWAEIEPPSLANWVAARRVDADLPWDFFWARGPDGGVLLTLHHATESAPATRLPRLRDIEVTLGPPDESNTQILAFKLLDQSQQDIFQTLCRDIISGAAKADSEAEAVSVSLMRTWRWHHLLRGGRGTLLSPEEQKGLLGELFVLERLLLPNINAISAVTAWRGPLGSPKDFEVARVAIESKARRGGATPFVSIASESQLDESGVDSLFLHVVELDEAPEDASCAVTLHEVAEQIRTYLFSLDPSACGEFESRLTAAGYRAEDDYSDYHWLEGQSRIYEVYDNFPRIASGEIRSGVSHVRYSVSLDACEPFATSANAIAEALAKKEGSDDD